MQNELLGTLAPADAEILSSHLTPWRLRRGSVVLYDGQCDDVLFPASGFFSVLVTMGERESEMNLVGREGLVGAPTVLAMELGSYRAIARHDCEALRISLGVLRRMISERRGIAAVILSYVRSIVSQLVRRSCGHAHLTLCQRLADWLVQADERAGKAPLEISHTVLSVALGANRSAVSRALRELNEIGAVRLEPRRIAIADRAKLAALVA